MSYEIDADWEEHGHVAVLTGRTMRIECPPGEHPGPYVCCGDCMDSGEEYREVWNGRDYIEVEVPCTTCNGTGFNGGERECFFHHWPEPEDWFDIWPEVDDGRYVLRYRTDGSGEDFILQAELGERLPDASTLRADSDPQTSVNGAKPGQMQGPA